MDNFFFTRKREFSEFVTICLFDYLNYFNLMLLIVVKYSHSFLKKEKFINVIKIKLVSIVQKFIRIYKRFISIKKTLREERIRKLYYVLKNF